MDSAPPYQGLHTEAFHVLLKIMLHGEIALLKVGYTVDKGKVMPHFLCQRVVGKENGIVYSLLQRLYVLAIDIGTEIIPEAPYKGDVWICVFQAKEILTTYPACLIVIFAFKHILEELRTHPVNVIDVECLELPAHHGCMSDGTTATEYIVQVLTLWQYAHYARGQLVLASLVG
jgi:hypothetical protein